MLGTRLLGLHTPSCISTEGRGKANFVTAVTGEARHHVSGSDRRVWLGAEMNARFHKKLDDRNHSGYSLVELLILLACIGVISGYLFIRAMTVLPIFKSNSAMDQVIQQMRVARNTAITDRRAVIVSISATTGMMQLQQVPPNGGPAVTLLTVPLTGAQFCLPPGVPDTPMGFGNSQAVNFVNASNPGTAVAVTEFLSDGSFGGAVGIPVNGTIFTCIPGNSLSARAVTILGATGRVRPYHWDGTAWQE
jgi:type II secretory pathway pseudopilin PulG